LEHISGKWEPFPPLADSHQRDGGSSLTDHSCDRKRGFCDHIEMELPVPASCGWFKNSHSPEKAP
jgi:hypothetical protein